MKTAGALWRGMRPAQWSKNVLIFAGLVFDGQLLDGDALLRVCAGLVLMCMIASSIYLINDLADLDSDRRHPVKRKRPLAAGEITQTQALVAALLLALLALAASFQLQPQLTVVLGCYFGLHLLYIRWLRNLVLIDILAITAGFVLRVVAGAVLVQVSNFSPWLYICSALLALFLAIAKRRQELLLLADQADELRVTFRHYNLVLLDDMLRLVTTSTFIAYMLYTVEADTIRVAETNTALVTIPFVLYGLLRYLWLIHVRQSHDTPDELLLRDRPLQLAILLWGASFVLILYLPGQLVQ